MAVQPVGSDLVGNLKDRFSHNEAQIDLKRISIQALTIRLPDIDFILSKENMVYDMGMFDDIN